MKSVVAAAAALALLSLPFGASAQGEDEEAEGGYVFALAGHTKHDLSRAGMDVATTAVLDELGPTAIRSSLDDSSFGGGLSLGYRLSPHVGLEVGYLTLGEAAYRADVDLLPGGAVPPATATFRGDMKVRGATLGLAAFVPFGSRFDVHARGGVFFARSELVTSLEIEGETSEPDHLTGHSRDGWYAYGIGFRLHERLQVTVDSTHFRGVGDRSETLPKTISMLGASLLYRF